MTAIVPEPSTALEALVGAPRLIVPGIASWIERSDFQRSVDEGFTESYRDYCTRTSEEMS